MGVSCEGDGPSFPTGVVSRISRTREETLVFSLLERVCSARFELQAEHLMWVRLTWVHFAHVHSHAVSMVAIFAVKDFTQRLDPGRLRQDNSAESGGTRWNVLRHLCLQSRGLCQCTVFFYAPKSAPTPHVLLYIYIYNSFTIYSRIIDLTCDNGPDLKGGNPGRKCPLHTSAPPARRPLQSYSVARNAKARGIATAPASAPTGLAIRLSASG